MTLATALAACCFCFAVSSAAAQGVGPEPEPNAVRIITDTPEYCAHLLSRIGGVRARVAGPARRADILTDQGRHMCAHHQIRPGIARLRRALKLLEALQ